MAQAWRVRAGTTVRYRDAVGRVFHAVVTAVTDQDTVDLRLGLAGLGSAVAGATRVTERDAAEGAGWYRSSELDDGPQARFSVTSIAGLVVGVSASASSTDDGPLTYTWDFGDSGGGSTSDGTTATPSHTYDAAGTYYIVLTVTDASLRTSSTSHRVTI